MFKHSITMSRVLMKLQLYQASCSNMKPRKICYFIHLRQLEPTSSICRNLNFIQMCSSCIIMKRLLGTVSDANVSTRLQYIIEAAEKRKEQTTILQDILRNSSSLSSNEWINIKQKVLSLSDSVNDSNIDGIIMNMCVSSKLYDVAKSYIEHLITSQQQINLATKLSFLRLCFLCRENTSIDKELIFTFYDSVRAEHKVFDTMSAENLAAGISLTERWRECVELLEMVKEISEPSSFAYLAICEAAFKNDEYKEGCKYMELAADSNKYLHPSVLHHYLDYCERHENLNVIDLVEKLLNFFAIYDILPSEDIVSRIKSIFDKPSFDQTKWQTSFTSINKRGFCMFCKKPLPRVPLTREEFRRLHSTFLDRILIGSDVFQKTNPKEVETFKQFLKNTKPYNLVCDGLNIAHIISKFFRNPTNISRCLRDVVEHCVRNSKSVLILGRKHMARWPRENMDYIYRNSQIFLADNLSEDDPFLLYATLYGGPDTCFMSRDLMRNYAFLLSEVDLKTYFQRWQQQHQYLIKYSFKNRRVILQPPLQFNPSAQCSKDGSWHIPYRQEFCPTRQETLEPPELWLCLKKDSRNNL